MTDYTKITLLCEDRQQEVFARHFLESCGIDKHDIYPDTCPKGKGAGEQYVRENFPRQVISYRKISHRLSAGLVVLTDADVLEVAERLRQLAGALEENRIPQPTQRERIGVFVPKRNIETWIFYLMGQAVNEDEVYPHFQKKGECKPFVRDLALNRKHSLPENVPPSLKTACRELPRILQEEI